MKRRKIPGRWIKDNECVADCEDESNYISCLSVHPLHFRVCSTFSEYVKNLRKCQKFEYEDDSDPKTDSQITCRYCWALGFKGLCKLRIRKDAKLEGDKNANI